MNNFETIIGIEIHIELNTKTKMFSSSPNNFNAEPNTQVSPIDIAYPGTLPVVNKQAVIKAIKLGKSLNMKINDTLYFDRKNYYYPDLPKGYQITQNNRPIGSNGKIKISNKVITIERIHLEEDTAKSIYKDGKTFLNFNRAGVPLIEIVSDPVIKNANEAAEYVQMIRDLSIALDISDAKMEEGSLRADVNISLRPRGQKSFGTKVEIKNLNSIANIKKAIEIEIQKQTKQLLLGKPIQMSTKRFNESTQDTITMRVKKEAADYKFFEEPNIPPIYIGKEFIDEINIGELPWERIERYKSFGLSDEYINNLVSNLKTANYFDLIDVDDKVQAAKIFFAEIVSLANSKNVEVVELNIDPTQLSILIDKLNMGYISGKHIKQIIPQLEGGKETVDSVIQKDNLKMIDNEEVINKMLNDIISENTSFIETNKERPERISKFILGQLMKKSQGQANPVIANKLVNKILEV